MKIVVGYDGSDAAKEALLVAKKHAKAFDGKVYVLTSLVGGMGESPEDMETAKRNLDDARKSVERDGIPVEQHLLVRGLDPGEDIVLFAEDNQVDEIIIGVVKKSKVQKFLFGSNAQFVLLHAPCMVIAVK
ncbi:MAG: universal stress protein [Syntrophales bacterium]